MSLSWCHTDSFGGKIRKLFREKKIVVASSLICRLTKNNGIGIRHQVQLVEKAASIGRQKQSSSMSEHFLQHLDS